MRDLTTNLLREVCHDVTTEPHLQPLSGETLRGRTSIKGDEARLDVSVSGFWGGGGFERAFVDIRVFNPNAPSNRSQSLQATFRKHKQEKRRQYGERVREIEQTSVSPLIVSSSGGMGQAAISFYKRLASHLNEKRHQDYSITMGWLQTILSFALLRSAIMCLRGSRARSTPHVSHDAPLDLIVSEGHLIY